MNSYNDASFNLAWQVEYEQRHTDVMICQHEGCQSPAIQCTIPGGIDLETGESYDESYEYFCPKHAVENGFCCCCGTFIAGWIENDDMCENCRDQVDSDFCNDNDDQYLGISDIY
jgi:hypothetical protein